jgi:hypothetical protein
MKKERAAITIQSSDQAVMQSVHPLPGWIQQRLKSDAAKTALGGWLALHLYCTLLGVALSVTVSPAKLKTFIQIVFNNQLTSCPPHYLVPFTGLEGALVGIWGRWDSLWYVEIANHGYTCYGSTAFMPLYPLLIRGLGTLLGGNMLAAALVISSVAGYITFYLLYQLAQELTGSSAIAKATVLSLALFPTSFFLMAGYTEALFLALAIGSYLAARRGCWLAAGALVALATLTRLQGIILLLPLGLELWLTHRNDLRRWQAWPALGIAPAALALYSLFIWQTQSLFPPWAPLSSARGPWHLQYAWPWQGIAQDMSALLAHPDLGTFISFKLFDPLTALLFALCTLIAFRRLNVPLAAFLAVMWFSSVIKVTSDGYTTSISRYMLALFPAFIILGMVISRWPRIARLGTALVSGLLLTISLLIFLIWGWVA